MKRTFGMVVGNVRTFDWPSWFSVDWNVIGCPAALRNGWFWNV